MAAPDTAGGNAKRLVVAGPSATLIARLRGGFLGDVMARGHAVLAIAPEMRAEDAQALIATGAEAAQFALKPDAFSLWPERKAIAALSDMLRQSRPDALLAFGNSVAPFAVLAAKRARVPRIALMISELPDRTLSSRLAHAAKQASVVVVHNREDERVLLASKAFARGNVVLVPGAGADLAGLDRLPMPVIAKPLNFVASARLDRVKGVLEYLEAARLITAETDAARFVLTGPEGTGAGAVQTEALSRYADCVSYTGDARDMREVLRDAHVFVSPSHSEGMPHALLQAMAAGRPVVATDIAGSRDAIDEMVNGTLVAPRSADALAGAFRRLIKHKDVLPAMARASRAKAERLFAMTSVNAKLMEALQLS